MTVPPLFCQLTRAQRHGRPLARRALQVHRRLGRAPVGRGARARRQVGHHEARVGRDLHPQPRHAPLGQGAQAARLAAHHRARCGARSASFVSRLSRQRARSSEDIMLARMVLRRHIQHASATYMLYVITVQGALLDHHARRFCCNGRSHEIMLAAHRSIDLLKGRRGFGPGSPF